MLFISGDGLARYYRNGAAANGDTDRLELGTTGQEGLTGWEGN